MTDPRYMEVARKQRGVVASESAGIRMLMKTVVDTVSGCWICCASGDIYGYPIVWVGRQRKKLRAARFAWELEYGVNPGELDVCHKCDNPPCINTSHLFLGTAHDNAMDAVRKGRWPSTKGELNHDVKLTVDAVKEIRSLFALGRRQIDLARDFGVAFSTIHRVVTRRGWRHV